jgi:hypothetical protein
VEIRYRVEIRSVNQKEDFAGKEKQMLRMQKRNKENSQ